MGCASNQNQHGFTLVEISIVMIIIGLLIGGTFGGMKLVENMQVNRTIQDLKTVESAALTFRDTYGRLPGDIRNPSARLPGCTDAPCATGGDGNRMIDGNQWWQPMTATAERFTFWHHLSAADLANFGISNTLSMEFGEGQPDTAVGGGLRMFQRSAPGYGGYSFTGTAVMIIASSSANLLTLGSHVVVECPNIRSIDMKIDDGMPLDGRFYGLYCNNVWTNLAPYVMFPQGLVWYDLKGF